MVVIIVISIIEKINQYFIYVPGFIKTIMAIRRMQCPPTEVGLDTLVDGFYHTHLVLAKAQCWILELLNGFFIEITVLFPQL